MKTARSCTPDRRLRNLAGHDISLPVPGVLS